MLPIRTILFGADFSKHSEHAFALAAALARDYSARLIIAHVRELPAVAVGEFGAAPALGEDLDDAKARLFAIKPAEATVAVEHVLVTGTPAVDLLELSETHHADLIVVGSHGRTGLARLLMGSVAERIVRGAKCPVLVVKQPLAEPAPAPLEKAEVQPAAAERSAR
ncbi:MAG: universal stress protein [Gemmataceae bacterium]|nr:universal stress protein [Gemmataceae bacterium]